MRVYNRKTIINIYERTENPNKRALKRRWIDDGSSDSLYIDAEVQGHLYECVPEGRGAVPQSADTCTVTIYNPADKFEAAEMPLVGDMLEVVAGHEDMNNTAPIFLGVIVEIPPLYWHGPLKALKLIANDGCHDWLGKQVDRDYWRDWECFDNIFHDRDPWTAEDIARDIVENECGLKFYAGSPTKGAIYKETKKVQGGAMEILYELSDESPLYGKNWRFYPPLVYLGDVYWNPGPFHKYLEVPLVLANERSKGTPMILKRLERAQHGRTEKPSVYRDQILGEPPIDEEQWGGSLWRLEASLQPLIYPGSIFRVIAELPYKHALRAGFVNIEERRPFEIKVQTRIRTHTLRANTYEFLTRATLKQLSIREAEGAVIGQ